MILSKWCIVLQIFIFQLHGGEITYLKGTCSAGKSTYIQSIKNEDLVVVDEDSIMQRSYVDAVAVRFPDAFSILQNAVASENLYHALREKDVLYKKESIEASNSLKLIQDELNQDLPWRIAVSQGIDQEVLSQVKDALDQNKNVLLDSWYIKPDRLAIEFPETKVVKVLLYCPLATIYQRFLKRNIEAQVKGDLTEKRYLRQLVGSFFSMYEISSQPLQPLHEVTRFDLDQVFDEMAMTLNGDDAFKKTVFTFEALSKRQFLEIKEIFLHPFKDTEEDLYLSPRDYYDIIIRS